MFIDLEGNYRALGGASVTFIGVVSVVCSACMSGRKWLSFGWGERRWRDTAGRDPDRSGRLFAHRCLRGVGEPLRRTEPWRESEAELRVQLDVARPDPTGSPR